MNNKKKRTILPEPLPPSEANRYIKDLYNREFHAYYHIDPLTSERVSSVGRTKSMSMKRSKVRWLPKREQAEGFCRWKTKKQSKSIVKS